MAKIEITRIGNSVVVEFNDYAVFTGVEKRSYDCRDIVELERPNDEDCLVVMMRDAHEGNKWVVTYDSTYEGDQYFIVDSVDGVEPTDNNDLFTKINALR